MFGKQLTGHFEYSREVSTVSPLFLLILRSPGQWTSAWKKRRLKALFSLLSKRKLFSNFIMNNWRKASAWTATKRIDFEIYLWIFCSSFLLIYQHSWINFSCSAVVCVIMSWAWCTIDRNWFMEEKCFCLNTPYCNYRSS